jgi:hypothetical protein
MDNQYIAIPAAWTLSVQFKSAVHLFCKDSSTMGCKQCGTAIQSLSAPSDEAGGTKVSPVKFRLHTST